MITFARCWPWRTPRLRPRHKINWMQMRHVSNASCGARFSVLARPSGCAGRRRAEALRSTLKRAPRHAALAILAVLLSSCQQRTKAAEDRAPTPVHAVPVKLFTPQSGERYSASLTPAQQLTLSFRVAGFV